MKAFRAAARKIERMIEDLAAGRTSEIGMKAAMPIFAAIDRLDSRANKGDIRGDDAVREEAYAIAAALRGRVGDAEEQGRQARAAGRAAEDRAWREREAERRAKDPAAYQYEQELKLLRGRGK